MKRLMFVVMLLIATLLPGTANARPYSLDDRIGARVLGLSCTESHHTVWWIKYRNDTKVPRTFKTIFRTKETNSDVVLGSALVVEMLPPGDTYTRVRGKEGTSVTVKFRGEVLLHRRTPDVCLGD